MTVNLSPAQQAAARAAAGATRDPVIFGVRIANLTRDEVADLFAEWCREPSRRRAVAIVNAHTLNLASENPLYRDVLRRADAVLGDGTGVRWAARRRGVQMRDNLVGTDLMPFLFENGATAGLRYYLLGGSPGVAAQATARLHARHPHLDIVGYRDGFFSDSETRSVVRAINHTEPHVLLVAMGNPLQELWIDANREALRVPISIGVGGLFDHWAGRLRRAPKWIRELGLEWTQILVQQPHKWRRYLIGNPKFVARAAEKAATDLAAQGNK